MEHGSLQEGEQSDDHDHDDTDDQGTLPQMGNNLSDVIHRKAYMTR